MQNGSITLAPRRRGPNVWEFRWREPGPDGRKKHRRIIIGSILELKDQVSALQAIAGLRQEINLHYGRLRLQSMTLSELADHYRQRELATDNQWKTHSTKVTYEGYLRKWIAPRWGTHTLPSIKAGEVELWLRHLPLARASCAKLRNLMSVLYNHARRYELFDRNPITLVRHSLKRRSVPEVLSVGEIRRILRALPRRERILFLIAVGTGLRVSELFALKWNDVDFTTKQISVTRSIVMQVVNPCKTEASQKPVPLDPMLAKALRAWRRQTAYRGPDDWVFASPWVGGRKPYWGQQIMRKRIRATAQRVGVGKRIGWHTLRHTYSTLLRKTGADLKVMQELLRHASIRVTLDIYTQAVTPAKRRAQSTVVRLFCPRR